MDKEGNIEKAIYFLLLISIAIVLLFTGCGRAKTFSDYRQNWNDFAKETVKTNQTTLSENMLLFPASEPIKLKNGGKNMK